MGTNEAGLTKKIKWDKGTGYDFLSSLQVLHFPDAFGLRGAWAAGVRSRLPNEARQFFEKTIELFNLPLDWVYTLAEPKDAATVLLALKRIPADERLAVLGLCPAESPALMAILQGVMETGEWNQQTLDDAQAAWRGALEGTGKPAKEITSRLVEMTLNTYECPEVFGSLYLASLQAYYDVFFAEEEKRIGAKLDTALAKAQKQFAASEETFIANLIPKGKEKVLEQFDEVILAPTYWQGTEVVKACMDRNRLLVMFAARPAEESLVPGEILPEELMARMKAMTDPTRLRILRYLLQEQLTPAELARRLRLRAPTVTHHLHILKTAKLVQFIKRGKNEHLYFAKMASIKETYVLLQDFLEQDVSLVEGFDLLDNELI